MNTQEFNQEIKGKDSQELADLLWQARWHIAVLKRYKPDWDELFVESKGKWRMVTSIAGVGGYQIISTGRTFATPEALAKVLREEREGGSDGN